MEKVGETKQCAVEATRTGSPTSFGTPNDSIPVDQLKLALNAKYGRSPGPFFKIRCDRCKIGCIEQFQDAVLWIYHHELLHMNKRKDGEPF